MIRSEHAHLQIVASSHPGMSGKNNEDRFAVTAYRLSIENPTPSLVAVVCDGIGGHRAGEVAAEIAVNTISQVVAESDGSQPLEVLQAAVNITSQKIFKQAHENEEQRGMGSTCACAWVIGNRLYTITVGDSRIYLQRGQSISRLSTDHTLIQELLDLKQITPDEVRNNPNAHVIRRFLGSAVPPAGDIRLKLKPEESDEKAKANQGLFLQPGDRILLCSDGLTDLVEDSEIKAVFDQSKTRNETKPNTLKNPEFLTEQELNTAVESLIQKANERGGHDNITVVVLQEPPKVAAEVKPSQEKTWPLALVGCVSLVAIALAVALALLGWDWVQDHILAVPASQTVTASLAASPTSGILLPSETPIIPTLEATAVFPSSTVTSQPSSLPALTGPTLTPWPTDTSLPPSETPGIVYPYP